jgi:hypothetical protein
MASPRLFFGAGDRNVRTEISGRKNRARKFRTFHEIGKVLARLEKDSGSLVSR